MKLITHAVSSDVRNQATGSPHPVSGFRSKTVNVDSFFTPICGVIFVALCVESIHKRSLPFVFICACCHSERKVITNFGLGFVCMCDMTCQPMALSLPTHFFRLCNTSVSRR